jgi:hypothetical protein
MDAGSRTQPVLLGGLFIGVLSALPVVNAGNCCCCLWVIAGGVLAVYLRQQSFSGPLTAAEGALVGLLAGLAGGVIAALLSIPLHMMLGSMQQEWMNRILESNQDIPPEAREMVQRMTGGAALTIGAIFNVIISTIFGMLGGLLGVAIFKKNVPPQPPPTMIPHDPGTAS